MSSREGVRRLVIVIGVVVFVDTMFYAAIAPLLPTLTRQLGLSKLSAGLMTASYPLGTLVGSLPGGMLAARAGPRFTVCSGLGLLACSTFAFGFLNDAVLLDLARFVEGVGGACSWAGGIAWIVAEAPTESRGAQIGAALGAAIGGALFGPVIGTIATATGRGAAFSGVVVIALVLIAVARRLHEQQVASRQGLRELRGSARDRRVLLGMWLVALPAVASGMLNVLGPLRLHHFGAAAAVIGATYLVGAGIEALLSPMIGRWSDRRGRLLPLRLGLLVAGALLACFTLPGSAAQLALLIVATVTALGAFWAPAMAMLADAADATGLNQGLGAALMNLAWAGGQIAGAGGGGALARAAGDAVPMLIATALCAVTLGALSSRLTAARVARTQEASGGV
jgi:MFS family permease